MRQVRGRSVWFVAVVSALASACAGSGADVDAGRTAEGAVEAQDGEWITHTLGPWVADREIVGAGFGDGIAVLTVEAPGDVRGYFLTADGTLERGSVGIDSSEPRLVTAITDGPNGLVATGNHVQPDLPNFVLTSPDGSSWTEPATTGLEAPMDVLDLTATAERYIAVGALRIDENPPSAVPVIVLSDDGTNWSRAQIPASEQGWINSVVSVGGMLYAAGDVGGVPVVWSSTDGGQAWAANPGAPPADYLVASGAAVLAIHADIKRVRAINRSDDGGATWRAEDASFADGFDLASFFGDERGFAIQASSGYQDPSSSPELCYADMDRCGPRSPGEGEAVFVRADGVDWSRLALDALTGLSRPSSILHNESGDTIVLGTTDGGSWGAWFWDSSHGGVPTDARSNNDVSTYDGPPIVKNGAVLEQGERYAFPLFIHCGMDVLGKFNDVVWVLVESPTGENPETGGGEPVPEDWPVVSQKILGYLTLVTKDRIEYSLEDGEVVGVYAPVPPGGSFPACA